MFEKPQSRNDMVCEKESESKPSSAKRDIPAKANQNVIIHDSKDLSRTYGTYRKYSCKHTVDGSEIQTSWKVVLSHC